MMNRNKRLLLNMSVGVIQQLVTIICGFILPRMFLLSFGSSVNGLISSITQFLSFIALLEMGIGPVIQTNLYKPLATGDTETISKIVMSAERFYRKIAFIFVGYIALLAIIFPTVITNEYDAYFTVSLLVIIAFSTIMQYLLGATYQVFLSADQKNYVHMIVQTAAVICNTVISVVLMKCGLSVHVVKLVSASIFVLRPIIQRIYVNKRYKINRKIIFYDEPIKQKWNGFAQHVAATVSGNTSTVVLTLFSPISHVSVYSIYNLITNGITGIVLTASAGVESFLGNIVATNDSKLLKQKFEMIEAAFHGVVTLLFTVATIAIIPFVSVYTDRITDVQYIYPTFGLLLVLSCMVRCIRIPYHSLVTASGHFKETQNGAFIMAFLNVAISVALVFKLGLVGVAIGSLVSMTFHTCYFIWYLRKNILARSVFCFLRHVLADAVVLIASCLLTYNIKLEHVSWKGFFIYGFKVGVVSLAVSVVVNLIVNFRIVKTGFKSVKQKIKNRGV